MTSLFNTSQVKTWLFDVTLFSVDQVANPILNIE